MVVTRTFGISNQLGMHALAATNFVRTAKAFVADVEVVKDGRRVDGKAVIDLLTLVAGAGTLITVVGRGADAEQAVEALGQLIAREFEIGADELSIVRAGHQDRSATGLPTAA